MKFIKISLTFFMLILLVNCVELIKITFGNKVVQALNSKGPSKPKFQRQARILGGSLVTTTEQAFFKHQVRLMCTDAKHKGSHLSCGGSLIAPNWVLTAGHCLYDTGYRAESCELYFGIISLLEKNKGQNRNVTQNDFVIPTEWKPESILALADIALIRINDPVVLNDQVGIIALPNKNEGCLSNEGKIATVSGWGMTDDNELTVNNILKTVDVEVATFKECKKTWGNGMNPNNMVCASGKNYIGTCEGDSGGPMVIRRENGERVLIGVTSFGMPSCVTEDHRIFTCTFAYRKWMETETGLQLFN